MKKVMKLAIYRLPGELEYVVGQLGHHNNRERSQESMDNITPVDMCHA